MRRYCISVLTALSCAAPSAGGAAPFCDGADETLIWSSCGSRPEVSLRLLPEDTGATPPGMLDVTGGYTGRDRRPGGLRKPVGLFVRDGAIIGREYVRFDGVLTLLEGVPKIHYRRRVDFADQQYDLESLDQRIAFLDAAAGQGASLLQSHLLIIDGLVDAAPIEGAPRFRRRILFQAADGTLGLYDSSPRALTLAAAAREVAERFNPAMALNLDMGSYDFCSRGGVRCGTLLSDETEKLSNILRFRIGGE